VSRRYVFFLVLLASLGLLGGLGAMGLTEPDEARYASVAREMLDSGDWLVPRLYGHAHLSKPPLTYWLAAASLRLFGFHEWAARLPAALAGLGSVLLTFALGIRLWGRAEGLASALILLTSPLFFAMGRILDPNMLLTLFTTMALWSATAFRQEGRAFHKAAFYMALALSFLAKGPVGAMIVLLALCGPILLRRAPPSAGRLWSWPAAVLCAACSIAWFALLAMRHPEAMNVFVHRELVARLFTEQNDRAEPWWFYLPVLPVAVLPWLPTILPAVVRAVRAARADGASALVASWVLPPLVVLSLSGSKLVTYILPLLPALALAGGRALAEGLPARLRVTQVLWGAAIAAAVLPAVCVLGVSAQGWTATLGPVDTPWLLPGAGALALILAGPPARRWLGAASLLLVVYLLLYTIVGRNDASLHPHSSVRAMASALRPHLQEGDRVVLLNRFPRGLSYYLRRPIGFPTYKFPLELAEDRERLAPVVFNEAVEVYRWFDSTQRVFVVLSDKALDNMKPHVRAPQHVLFDDGRTLVISNR
jgi:4-amino-4-deoxy-L-arabinose transferase-like glycosyltransferase